MILRSNAHGLHPLGTTCLQVTLPTSIVVTARAVKPTWNFHLLAVVLVAESSHAGCATCCRVLSNRRPKDSCLAAGCLLRVRRRCAMKTRLLLAVIAAISLFASLAGPAMADGMVIVNNAATGVVGPPMPPGPPFILPSYLTVKYHRVEVTITDQVAQTKVDQVFVNDYDREMEGTYIFPLPEDAAISNFVCTSTARRWRARSLTKEEARRIYEETVQPAARPGAAGIRRSRRLPGPRLSHPGQGRAAHPTGVHPGAGRDNDLVRYVYPLSTEKFSPSRCSRSRSMSRSASREAIKAVYSSSHDVAVLARATTAPRPATRPATSAPTRTSCSTTAWRRATWAPTCSPTARPARTATSCCWSRPQREVERRRWPPRTSSWCSIPRAACRGRRSTRPSRPCASSLTA